MHHFYVILKSGLRTEPFVGTLGAHEVKDAQVFVLVVDVLVSSAKLLTTTFELAEVFECLLSIGVQSHVISQVVMTSERFATVVELADEGSDAFVFVQVSGQTVRYTSLVVTSGPRAVQRLFLALAALYYPRLTIDGHRLTTISSRLITRLLSWDDNRFDVFINIKAYIIDTNVITNWRIVTSVGLSFDIRVAIESRQFAKTLIIAKRFVDPFVHFFELLPLVRHEDGFDFV